MKTHPLTNLQFLLAVLMAIPMLILPNARESEQDTLFLLGMISFLGLSIVTFYLGWLMVVKKEDVFYLFQIFGIRFTEKTRGKRAAKDLISKYAKPWWKMLIGIMNMFSGLLCFIGAILGIVVALQIL